MSFFIRKAFRFGPLRFNLSRGGVGVSAGITGARLGIDGRGRPYVAGGRHGLYYREYLRKPGGGATAAPGSPAGAGGRGRGAPAGRLKGNRVELWEPTGATFAPENATSPEPPEPPTEPPSALLPWGTLAVLGIILAVFLDGVVAAAGLLILAVGAGGGVWVAVRERRVLTLARELDAMVARGRWDPALGQRIAAEGRFEPGRTPRGRLVSHLKQAHREACRALATGEQVDEDEWVLIRELEQLLGGPSSETREIRADALRGLIVVLAADHRITDEEWEILDRVREGLRLDPEDLEEDLDLIQRLREVERLRTGELPEVKAPVRLRQGERAHFNGRGRLLRDRQLRRFQRAGVAHVVRGWVVDREGPLVLTDRRLMLLDGGAYEIPLREVLDLEVDLDDNLIQIVRDGRANPIVITTPDALSAGTLLARLTEM
ncbi:MAG: DUF4236 domain-containing protein [Gemmatimonadales bacterium]|nr:MAG: DUF4236 domain-containing protein [Gemmatimonadales bacterium]